MRVLGEASKGGRAPVMLSTHPYPEQRQVEIERYLAAR
jgi:predicted Zn-dependent protease